MFFVWFDDSSKKTLTDKLDEAIKAYTVKFLAPPSHILVNSADQTTRDDVIVAIATTVQPNTFWLSRQETAETA